MQPHIKWTRILALPVFLCSLVVLLLFVAPLLFVLLLHSSLPLWMSHLRQSILPGGDLITELVNRKFQSGISPMSQPFTWIIFSCILITYILASIHVKLLSKGVTFGSSDYARRHHIRGVHAGRAHGRLLHALLAIAHAPVTLAATATHVLMATPHNARARRTRATAALFHIGVYHHRLIALPEKLREEHALIVGPTGSRKSTLLIIRNLLYEAQTDISSLCISDLKGELFDKTAGAMAQLHQVWRFAPAEPDASHSYNPLAYVHDATDANILADCWVRNTGESKVDPFWDTCARMLICSVILHLRATEPHAPFSRLADYLTGKPFEALKDILTHSPSLEARRKMETYLDSLSRSDRLMGAVFVETANRFELFDSAEVRQVTALNEIDFEAMVDVPTALYLSIPEGEAEFYRPLLACLTMQMFRVWRKRARREATRALPRSIACYLDEFANLGYIPSFSEFISTVRSIRVSLLMVIQNFSQLDKHYGAEDAETIRENANTHILMPGAGPRECEHYSKRIGDTTVRTWSRTSRGTSWWRSEDSWTEGEARRRLLTPEELRTMPERTMLMLRSSLPPMLPVGTPYYEDKRVAHLANIPYHVTHMHKQPPAPAQNPPDTTRPQQPPTVIVDADLEDQNKKSQDKQHFLKEE
jgi:type IV secretory pathway TraG/TraD family ATPase VirD4